MKQSLNVLTKLKKLAMVSLISIISFNFNTCYSFEVESIDEAV
jgi:hypothetical protein